MIYRPHIIQIAHVYGLDAKLLEAQILVESSGNPWAWNPEPKYRYLWDVAKGRPFRALSALEIQSEAAPDDFPTLAGDRDQEWWAQQASWGLMQILGAVARELGATMPYLTALCDPVINLELGARHLKNLITWAHGEESRALAAYNGGQLGNAVKPYRNQAYADRVFARRATLGG